MKRDYNTLRQVGEDLYGPNWQTPLAAALGVTDRTVRYWAAGRDIPDGVWGEIGAICRQRAGALEAWAKKLSPSAPYPQP